MSSAVINAGADSGITPPTKPVNATHVPVIVARSSGETGIHHSPSDQVNDPDVSSQEGARSVPDSPQNDPENSNAAKTPESEPSQRPNGTAELSPAKLRLVQALKQTDQEVRTHEMAHVAAGGSYITSGASYTYKKGPDGKTYAVAGEVRIDTAPIPGNPEATIEKMQQIRRAALAPATPSDQDRRVAAKASSQALKAVGELARLSAKAQAKENNTNALGTPSNTANDIYESVSSLTDIPTDSFQITV